MAKHMDLREHTSIRVRHSAGGNVDLQVWHGAEGPAAPHPVAG